MAEYFGVGNYSAVGWSCRAIESKMVREKRLRDRIEKIIASMHQLHFERPLLTLIDVAYLSYFDPDGLGAMTKNIKKISKSIPVFLAIGTTDPFFRESKALVDSAPAHPASRYVALDTDHSGVLKIVGPELLKWLELIASTGTVQ